MQTYRAPLRELQFILQEVLDIEGHYRSLGREEMSAELVAAILEEAARFAEDALAPLNAPGDAEGVELSNEGVRTPSGYREAYRRYCENGWASIVAPAKYGGQGLPASLEAPLAEMLNSANLAWRTYSGLNTGAMLALRAHASEQLKSLYLPKLATGEWLATMCLTEPQCGTDLALIRTRAEPAGDGGYRIHGTKMFITGGDHDLTPNILHLVLARLPDAPAGSKGISLFAVPKLLNATESDPGASNGVRCESIESKMGLRGSATCVLNFDDAKAWLVGAPHGGLACMFTMMNHARLSVAVQGIGVAELARQRSVAYAQERRQGRAVREIERSSGPADPIIVHPDVRRMLLTQKALVEGCRALASFAALQLDRAHEAPDAAARADAEDLLALLTPITKAFITEAAVECASLGVQIHGGHGYIKETGMEQILRDARILPIYEGTNGVQALDLLGRKVLGNEGRSVARLIAIAERFCDDHAHETAVGWMIARLRATLQDWNDLTGHLIRVARTDAAEIGGAAVDYLQYSGYVCLAWCWTRMAVAAAAGARTDPNSAFYVTKLATAQFYFQRLLPRADSHAEAARAGAAVLMKIEAAEF